MSAFTTWLCLRIWGVTFFRESFCRRETSWIPASSARRSMVRNTVLVLRWPELRPGKSHTWPGWMLSWMACKVPWLTRVARKMLMLLRERGVPLDYTVDDAEKDFHTLKSVLGR